MGLRLLLIGLAIFLIFRLLRRVYDASKTKHATPLLQPIPYVNCHQCQLHIPKHDAFGQHPLYFCSKKHQQQARTS